MDSENETLSDSASVYANGGTTTDHLTKIGVIAVDQRVKRKAKRLLKQHSKETPSEGTLVHTRHWKNSRKPRNGFSKRGLPKKGGAGGKGVWGKLGSESDGIDDIDRNDPNYDSDNVDDGDVVLKSVLPELSDEEMKKNVELIVLEYYEHGDTEEALLSFDELNCSSKKYLIPYHAIEIALDHKPSHREMTSVLLSDLTVRILRPKEMIQAFEMLLINLPDLILDTPDAPTVLGNYLARAVADVCMPPNVMKVLKDKVDNQHAREALTRAETLLSSQLGLYRLDNIWGIGGGLRPVKTLSRQMNLLLEEYLSSNDIPEATRCVVALEVPHFHHELVYEAIILTLESLNPDVETAMCAFLKSLSDAVIVTPEMMERGFLRVFEDMPDIILDIPLAYTVLERFVEKCSKAGFIPDDVTKKVPMTMRGRKRFVSEGDGGRVKEHY
ncbi:hypothetical protein V9T40_014705 [Parthenolecanium corni]|uniref:Programmed cell death protein 4 n=1 Tax=Parthenolecanium corni TaxID=536013 RepID=A0AAN9XXX5_9HEMI